MAVKNTLCAAIAQFDIQLFQKEYNLKKIERLASQARNLQNADLVVFPECSLTGYCMDSMDEVRRVAEPKDGPSIQAVSHMSRTMGIGIVFGMIEMDGGAFYNTAVCCMPDGSAFYYRKTHLPQMGVDRLLNSGDTLEPFETEYGTVGMIICYDLRFPEPARAVALQGARMILQPTNLPDGGEAHPDFFTRARACENRVFLLSVNRIGQERDCHFIGRSQIVDPSGNILAELGAEEGVASARIDLAKAEQKDIIRTPETNEMHVFSDRRPELYTSLCKENRT